ncbi:MAG: hypothetical protein M1839_006703 [Geoglossum umbratile]|nr:MAG: hypothetical protein M1839_006703 [Geoglossum umbratile]
MASGIALKPWRIPIDSLILVTGVTGYIASHVANALLEKGYQVRGTVRDAQKARWVNTLFEEKFGQGRFETVVVGDMAVRGAFDEAVKGAAGIAHVASIVTLSPDPNDVIPQSIAGTLNILASATNEPCVKSVVLTSSSTAMTMPKPNVELTIDENSWNDEVVPIALAPPPYDTSRAHAVYAASKMLSEREAWKFVRENNPGFVFNSIVASRNFGEILDPVNQLRSTGAFCQMLLQGNRLPIDLCPPHHFVDVKDAALLHVAALINPEVRNERVIAWAAPYSWNAILAMLRQARPGANVPDDDPNEVKDITKVSNSRAEDLLRAFGRPGWTGLETSIMENLEALEKLGNRGQTQLTAN